MTIKRTVNGTEYEFELTLQELVRSSQEYDVFCAKEDLPQAWEEEYPDEPFPFPLDSNDFEYACWKYVKYRKDAGEWMNDALFAISYIQDWKIEREEENK